MNPNNCSNEDAIQLEEEKADNIPDEKELKEETVSSDDEEYELDDYPNLLLNSQFDDTVIEEPERFPIFELADYQTEKDLYYSHHLLTPAFKAVMKRCDLCKQGKQCFQRCTRCERFRVQASW